MLQAEEKQIMVSASVSCMDLCHLGDAVKEAEQSDISFFHYDMVDGRFNNCFILSETLLEHMRRAANLPVEAHLAAYEPERYINLYANAGADYLAVHYEAMEEPFRIFAQIRKAGCVPVLAYKAETPPGDDFAELAAEVPWVLKLTVNPGFSGQKMQEGAVSHISRMREMLNTAGLKTKIQADGNISQETIPKVVKAGADILTGGTSGLFVRGKAVRQCCSEMIETAKKAKGE
ncbi:ribulose-phosphate 3-epimerase [Anaerostipes sp.]|uniref:ribulose-phosphate 3-epimerase n=1 Tax=Anaerostipes sp. TaxID=1872530 RepID=UPI0025BCFE51|nr:ribulose-phosphate 3-epimerase [Anaerostipes sp.]MBS7008651.1 ribulose-phosphate 3-epimerase [Anaerostipes sp.]